MPVVERPCAAGLERVSALADLAHMKLGAPPDHGAHRHLLKDSEIVGVPLQPFEEFSVADEDHSFRHARDFIPDRKLLDEFVIIQNGEGRRERATKFLEPKRFTPFFTPTPESFWDTVVGTRICRMPR